MPATTNKKDQIKKMEFLLPVLSAVLLVFASPNFGLWALVWLALVPLFIALKNKNFKQTIVLGLIFGFASYIGYLFWLPISAFHITNSYWLAILVWILASAYPALSLTLSCILYNFIRKYFVEIKTSFLYKLAAIIAIPSLWVALEFAQFKLFKGFPYVYYFLGASQWNDIYILQIASFVGEIGISFIIVLVNYSLFRLLENRKAKEVIFSALILTVCVAYGVWILNFKAPLKTDSKNTIKAVVLNGNIDSMIKWQNKEKVGDYIAQTYLDLNKKAVSENPNLIIWTETAIPWPMEPGDDLIEASLNITQPSGAYHIIGMPSYAKDNKVLDSAFFITPDGLVTGEYDKQNLIDFVESDAKFGSALSVKIGESGANNIPGERHLPLDGPLGKIGVLICNENLYQDYTRTIAKNGAKFLVTTGNDSLLANDTIIKNHFIHNAFRAVENRKDVVIAINSGISGLVDAYGRTVVASFEKEAHIVPVTVTEREQTSFYTKYGDVFMYFCILFGLISVVSSFYLSKQKDGK
jgi:apolipoprotein N-acyltransferase